MIEDKKNGIKIAETPLEAKRDSIRQRSEEGIEQNKIEQEINQAILEMAEKKLKDQSIYTSYAKDLFIACLQTGSKMTGPGAEMKMCIELVKQARDAFKE